MSDTVYFVYCNGQDAEAFDGCIKFTIKLLPYTGRDNWVEGALIDLKACLMNDTIPKGTKDCEFCGYTSARITNEVMNDTVLRAK